MSSPDPLLPDADPDPFGLDDAAATRRAEEITPRSATLRKMAEKFRATPMSDPTAAVTLPSPVIPTLVLPPAPIPLTLDRDRGATAPVPARFSLMVARSGVYCITARIAETTADGTPLHSPVIFPMVLACGGADGSGPFVDLPLYNELTLARFEPGYYVILVQHPDPDRSGIATVKAWRADPARPAVGQAGVNP